MNNKTKKKNTISKSSINPFQEDFSNSNENQDNQLSQTMFNLNELTLQNKILGKIPTDIIFENKIKQQLSDKSINGRRNSRFISGKNINEFRDSLKDVNIFFSSTEESLNLRKIPKISKKDYDNMKDNIIDMDNLTKLNNTLKNVNCNYKNLECGESVGGISPLTFLIEKSYSMDKAKIKEMSDKYNILKNYIYNYRTINGDGNCFYRAVMFRYLEILILNNKIEYLQNLINDIIICFNKEELKQRTNIRGLNIKPELTYKILILIVDLLKYNKKEEAHQILVKSFSTSKKFDYAIILYFRYILYDYIRNNENKVYLKTFPIKLGNLLPRQYETEDGHFLFDKFYQNYLLNFFTDAEKIIIYLTPLVIGIELNVVIYDDNEEEILQKFRWEGNTELQIDDVISLLNSRNHYEIIYTLKDNEKNKNIFTKYENNQKSLILSEIDINKKKIDIKESDNFNLLADSMKLNIEDIKNSMKPQSQIYKKNINTNSNQNNNNIIENKKNNNNIDNNINNIHNKNFPNKNIQNNIIHNNNNNNNISKYNKNPKNNLFIPNNNPNNINNQNKNSNIQNNINIGNSKINNNNSSSFNENNKNINNNGFFIGNKNNKDLNNNNPNNKNYLNNYYTNQTNNNTHNENSNHYQNYRSKNNYNNISNNNPQNQMNQKQSIYTNYYTHEVKHNNNYNNILNQNDIMISKQKSNQNNIKNNINNADKNNNKDISYKNQQIGLKTPGQESFQSNINQSDISNRGFITPYSNKNKNKCMNCGINIENQSIDICKECFKSKIIDVLFSLNIEDMKNDREPMNFNGTIENKTKKYKVIDAIIEYNKIYNENLNKEQIINELKMKICRLCKGDIKKENYKLPCNCHFCSKDHLYQYLQSIQYEFSKDFKCNCSQTYTRKMMISLSNICNELRINYYQDIIQYFNNKLYNICCICGKTSNIKYRFINLFCSNKNDNFIKLLNHYFCNKCYHPNSFNSFLCSICTIEHYFNN